MKENEELKKDSRSKLEKTSDAVEDFFDDVEDVVYGEKNNILEDIPATIETPSRRKVLKIQTQKNIQRKLFNHKWFYIGFGILLALGGLGFLIRYIVIQLL